MAEEPKIACAPPPSSLLLLQPLAAADAHEDARENAAAAPASPPIAASYSCNGTSSSSNGSSSSAATNGAVEFAAAPADAASSDAPRQSPASTLEEELVAASDDSDAATDETGSASADDPPAATLEATVAGAAAGATAATEVEENDAPPSAPDAQRKRKRAKRLGFSGSKPKPKRNGVCALSDAALATATHKQQQNGAQEAPDSPLFQDSAALYPSAVGDGGVAWDWSMSDVYYAPLGQESLDQLECARKSCANIVAANVGACRGVEQETAQLAAMLRDAGSGCASARVRPLRRGRRYRDMWDEEDFLHAQRKRGGFLVDKKRGFGDQDALLSNHELVHGYDDDLFERYISQLEAESRRQQSHSSDDTKTPAPGGGEKSGGDAVEPKRKAKAPPRSLLKSVLPSIPLEQCHPAAWGAWVLKNPTMDFEAVHPASISRKAVSSRWREESVALTQLESEQQQQKNSKSNGDADTDEEEFEVVTESQQHGGGGASLPVAVALWGNGKDDVTSLPSFGSAVEDDEISREIASSLARLIPLSMLNWRLAQTVYERAGVYAQCSSVIEQEVRVSKRIEALYQRLYPPRDDDDEQDERVQAPRRIPVFHSLRADLVTHSLKFCRDNEEVQCVAASVEYALTLQVGDEVDVLDRNGCWNDGVVVDVFRESGQVVKYVLLRLSLWDASGSEWVSVTEGRILPRGVADGKTTFTIGPTRSLKHRTEFNRALADTLEKTLPVRHVEQNAAALERKRSVGKGRDDAKQQKKVKRAL